MDPIPDRSEEWLQYKQKYNKVYKTLEEDARHFAAYLKSTTARGRFNSQDYRYSPDVFDDWTEGLSPENPEQWRVYKETFNKVYKTPEEDAMRYALFLKRKLEIEEHNNKGLSWTMGYNKFTDWTEAEMKRHC